MLGTITAACLCTLNVDSRTHLVSRACNSAVTHKICDLSFVSLCSIGVFRYLVAPAVRHLLEAGLHTQLTAAPVEWLLSSFELLYNALWLFPAYVISLIVNTLWYVSPHPA